MLHRYTERTQFKRNDDTANKTGITGYVQSLVLCHFKCTRSPFIQTVEYQAPRKSLSFDSNAVKLVIWPASVRGNSMPRDDVIAHAGIALPQLCARLLSQSVDTTGASRLRKRAAGRRDATLNEHGVGNTPQDGSLRRLLQRVVQV